MNFHETSNFAVARQTNSRRFVMTQREKQSSVNLNVLCRTMATILLCSLIPAVAIAGDDDKEQARVKSSGEVLKELLNGPSGIPLSVLNKSECVIVLPSVKKAGFIVGASTVVES